MKRNLPAITITFTVLLFLAACSRKHYTNTYFEQQTVHHKIIAILPAEMVFTGTQPNNISPEDLRAIEEAESSIFQNYLFNSILRYANTNRYYMRIGVQDISTTQKLLQDAGISVRDSWKEDDRKLAKLLGVDAVVRMRIQKKRYMSDLASLGVSMGQQVLYRIGNGGRIPVPYVSNKTNDIYASCNIVSNNQTLWSNDYRGASNYNRPSEDVIRDITDRFGGNFPYKRRK